MGRLISKTPVLTSVVSIIAALMLCATAQAGAIDDATRRDVTIAAGDVTLGATLYFPKDATGGLPAIVTAHGSAPSTRDGVSFYTDTALSMGFAVLSFDKRGTGVSTGEYERFNVADSPRIFDDLAMDIVHSVRWLTDQDNIDASQIGLLGGSQAGWIMPIAASKEPLVSFVIIGEGVPVTAGEESEHGHFLASAHGSENDPDITSADIAAADAALAGYDGAHGFDPMPVLKQIDTPTLWIFGLRDTVIPVHPSLFRLEALIRAGKTNNHVHIFPFGDHNFTNTATGGGYDVAGAAKAWLISTGVLE